MKRDIELAIISGTKSAQKQHVLLNDDWLGTGPEYFLTVHIARHIAKGDRYVYVDAGLTKLARLLGVQSGPGRKVLHLQERPDIAVKSKADNRLAAIIEVKRAWSISPIDKDVNKVRGHLGYKHSAKYGYVAAYSSSESDKPVTKLKERFSDWAERLKVTNVADYYQNEPSTGWAWGVAVYQV